MQPMIVLTVKKDRWTQDVVGFYTLDDLEAAVVDAHDFLASCRDSKRAIARIEMYNPRGENVQGSKKA